MCDKSLSLSLSLPPPPHTDHTPTLPSLIVFNTASGTINIVERIGRKYNMFGPLLLNDTTGAVTQAIERQYNCNADDINLEILRRWINGGGIQPVTWSTLTNVLRRVGLAELARDIEQST